MRAAAFARSVRTSSASRCHSGWTSPTYHSSPSSRHHPLATNPAVTTSRETGESYSAKRRTSFFGIYKLSRRQLDHISASPCVRHSASVSSLASAGYSSPNFVQFNQVALSPRLADKWGCLRGVVRWWPADHPGAARQRAPGGPAPVLPAAVAALVRDPDAAPRLALRGPFLVAADPGRGSAVLSPVPGRMLIWRRHAVAPHRSAPALASTAATNSPATTATANMSKSRCRAASTRRAGCRSARSR